MQLSTGRSTPSRRDAGGRGVDLFVIETFFDVDELWSRSRPCVESRRCRSSPCSPSTRTARPSAARRRARRPSGSAAGRARRSARTRRRAARGLTALARMGGDRPAARRDAERRPARRSPAAGSSTRTRARSTSPSSRRTPRARRRLVGGCCGTTPAQIEAIREALSHAARRPSAPFASAERELAVAAAREPRDPPRRAARGR